MILLDTCTLLWLAADQKKLSARARSLIAKHAGALFISAITAFEIALKHRKRRLVLPLEPEQWIERALTFHGVAEIPVDWRVAARSTAVDVEHADPCDRIILATAEARDLLLLTPDPLMKACPSVRVEW